MQETFPKNLKKMRHKLKEASRTHQLERVPTM